MKIEFELMPLVPRERWVRFSHQLIAHGRAICRAPRPLCAACFLDATFARAGRRRAGLPRSPERCILPPLWSPPDPFRGARKPRPTGSGGRRVPTGNNRPESGDPPRQGAGLQGRASGHTVLVQGESGVGKELVARSIHEQSPRRDRPYVVVDCGMLNENLLQNELFGHQRGAFTGATALKHGLFEVADTGTLFLDEIGEVSPVLQAKLLRVLETGSFRRLGSTADLQVDVRLVAATNRDLLQMSREGTFREDLYTGSMSFPCLSRPCASGATTSRCSRGTSCAARTTRRARRASPRRRSTCSSPTTGRETSANCRT